MEKLSTPLELKASLLSNGVRLSDELLANYGPPYLPKRRGYGNQDPLRLRNVVIPQEVFLNPGDEQLVAAVNVKDDSPLMLDHDDEGFCLVDNSGCRHLVDFPLTPEFYDMIIDGRKKVSQVVTLYGGGSLGIFAYGKCALVEMDKPCHYCSISQNRDKGTDFDPVVTGSSISEALTVALQHSPDSVSQIMLNGGNFPDRDKSFIYYTELFKTLIDVIHKIGREIEPHLIVYPPKDLKLIERLEGLPIGVAMNTEVFDKDLFEKYCPGKVETGGRDHMFAALEKAVEVLGRDRVFSIMVGGLEPVDSLDEGLNFLADRGVTPVINVLHTDPETPLEGFPNPSEDVIMEMGRRLQAVYETHDFEPFYLNCGRNSLDAEAYNQLF